MYGNDSVIRVRRHHLANSFVPALKESVGLDNLFYLKGVIGDWADVYGRKVSKRSWEMFTSMITDPEQRIEIVSGKDDICYACKKGTEEERKRCEVDGPSDKGRFSTRLSGEYTSEELIELLSEDHPKLRNFEFKESVGGWKDYILYCLNS